MHAPANIYINREITCRKKDIRVKNKEQINSTSVSTICLYHFGLSVLAEAEGLSFTLSASRVKLETTGTLKMACNVTERDASLIYNIQIRRETDPGSKYTWETIAEIDAAEGLSFTLSASRVKVGTTGTLKMACNVTELDASLIYNIQIRRETDPGSKYTWETIAEIEAGVTEVPVLDRDIVNDKGFVLRGVIDKDTPINTYLTLDMNKDKLTYSDARDYRCELTYKSNITGSVAYVIRNASLSIVSDDDHDKMQPDTRGSLAYDYKTKLVIVTVSLGVTIMIVAIGYARYRTRAGGSIDECLHLDPSSHPTNDCTTPLPLASDQNNELTAKS
ncbi:uncharacterized protein LOC123544773 isoform X3 [Mercenaria mercenaria]|uniref:uncharacterized protein LOC123544773 isoform X3 n=1 Tax=Mercenaria mercenaria TaxID=6596 RepID=UPI00234FA835|nr:uncharacterized protein LOC123544773 isoform X3 [Mercenaria mercenaria]